MLRLRCAHFKYGCNNRSSLLHQLEKMLLKERRKKEEEKEQVEHTLIPEIENVLDLYHATTSVDKKMSY
ncbi:hypothetical protein EDD57_12818 [Baia soyae]|uniref:Uncharacterized protein n=1 Tax=Baia soyae TaxID=1544746 RepID=A0A4R2RS58_9BACL|nr:hypothetical protein EDD57_12818 [Baia soyae]